MTQSICAFSIVVPEYDAGIAFYVGRLGFTLIEDIDLGDKRWVVVAPSGGGVEIILARAKNSAEEAAIGNQTGGRVGFFLQTDDFAGDFERMQDMGITFEEPPRVEPYGTVAVWCDPFGNRWDLLQRAT